MHLDDTFRRNYTRPRKNPDAVSEFILEYFDHKHIPNVVESTTGLVIIDGLFLFRTDLLKLYDFTIRLELPEEHVFERARKRDMSEFKSWGNFALHYISQAIAAQRIYSSLCQPSEVADLTIFLQDSEGT